MQVKYKLPQPKFPYGSEVVLYATNGLVKGIVVGFWLHTDSPTPYYKVQAINADKSMGEYFTTIPESVLFATVGALVKKIKSQE